MKKNKYPPVLVLPMTIATILVACTDEQFTTGNMIDTLIQDKYLSIEDCIKDWKNAELCSPEKKDEPVLSNTLNTKYTEIVNGVPVSNTSEDKNKDNNGSSFTPLYFYGPSYYPNNRAVAFQSRPYSPTTSSSIGTTYNLINKAKAVPVEPAARSSYSSSSATNSTRSSTSGFGSTAKAMSSSSIGG